MIGAAIEIDQDISNIDVVQIFSQNTNDSSIRWTPNEIKKIKNKKIYAHAMYKAILNQYFGKKIITEHYKYLCENEIYGYVIHIPANIEINDCINNINSFLKNIQKYIQEEKPNHKTILFFENMPSEYYSKAQNMLKFATLLKQKSSPYNIPLGICLDTCHIYVSGINIGESEIMISYMNNLNIPKIQQMGIHLLIHLNDSLFPIGSFRDQHAQIGNLIWKDDLSSLNYLIKNYEFIDMILEIKNWHLSLNLINEKILN